MAAAAAAVDRRRRTRENEGRRRGRSPLRPCIRTQSEKRWRHESTLRGGGKRNVSWQPATSNRYSNLKSRDFQSPVHGMVAELTRSISMRTRRRLGECGASAARDVTHSISATHLRPMLPPFVLLLPARRFVFRIRVGRIHFLFLYALAVSAASPSRTNTEVSCFTLSICLSALKLARG